MSSLVVGTFPANRLDSVKSSIINSQTTFNRSFRMLFIQVCSIDGNDTGLVVFNQTGSATIPSIANLSLVTSVDNKIDMLILASHKCLEAAYKRESARSVEDDTRANHLLLLYNLITVKANAKKLFEDNLPSNISNLVSPSQLFGMTVAPNTSKIKVVNAWLTGNNEALEELLSSTELEAVEPSISRNKRDLTKKPLLGVEIEFFGMSRSIARERINMVFPSAAIGNDLSIRNNGSGDQIEARLALVTVDDIPKIKRMLTDLVARGAAVNDSCGLHIHANMFGYPTQLVSRLLKKFSVDEDFIIAMAGTSQNRLGRHTKPLTKDSTYDLLSCKKLKGTADIGDRYRTLNVCSLFKHGTVEYRLFNGTLDGEVMSKWIQFVWEYTYTDIGAKELAKKLGIQAPTSVARIVTPTPVVAPTPTWVNADVVDDDDENLCMCDACRAQRGDR